MLLSPHHLIDIIAGIGRSDEIKAHDYGHAVHLVMQKVLDNSCGRIKLIAAADDICGPCVHLQKNKKCDDLITSLKPPLSKQQYNDKLDRRLFKFLNFPEGKIMVLSEFLEIINKNIEETCVICTHPGEDSLEKAEAVKKGITLLGQKK